jgi:hypothetical protein
MRRLTVVLLLLSVPRAARADETREVAVGAEDLYFLSDATALNRDNVLGLDRELTILRGSLSFKESRGAARGVFRGFAERRFGAMGQKSKLTLREAYGQLSSNAGSVRLGKQRLAWGSGFVWNPTSRLEPPKNPLDTSLEQPGVAAVRADWTPSSITRLTLVAARVETRSADSPIDLPKDTRAGAAARLGLTLAKMDVAAVVSLKEDRAPLFGADAARTLGGKVSAHVEAAAYDSELPSTAEGMRVRIVAGLLYTRDAQSFALEYFRNGEGYGDRERGAWLAGLQTAYATSTNDALPEATRNAARASYLAGTVLPYRGLGLGRDYVNASWTHRPVAGAWELSVRGLASITDGGVALTPSVAYTASGRVTLRVDGLLLHGPEDSEYALLPVRGGLITRVKVQF